MVRPEWLRYFVTLAETRNFHAAAERLHLTPQALSKAIASLEAHYRLSLVERDHRVKGLTPAGEAFLEEARGLLEGLENAERRMAEWREGEPQGAVTIAGVDVWVNYLMPGLLPGLLARYPKIRPRFFNMLPDDVVRWVAAGEVDLGLLLAPPADPALDWAVGETSPYVIAGQAGRTGHWSDFGYIVPRFFRREAPVPLDGWREDRFDRRIACEVEMMETAIYLAEAGVGVAFLPELAVRDRLAKGTLAVVAEPPAPYEDRLHVIWRKGIRATPAVKAVLERLSPGDRS